MFSEDMPQPPVILITRDSYSRQSTELYFI